MKYLQASDVVAVGTCAHRKSYCLAGGVVVGPSWHCDEASYQVAAEVVGSCSFWNSPVSEKPPIHEQKPNVITHLHIKKIV